MLLRWTAIILLALGCGASLGAARPPVHGSHLPARPVIPVDSTSKWYHPKDVFSRDLRRRDPRDCAGHPVSRDPECAGLEPGGADIGTDRYFTDPEMDHVPVTRNYPTDRSQQKTIPLRRSAGRAEFPTVDRDVQEQRYLRGMTAQLLLMTFEGQAVPQAGLVSMLRRLRQGEVNGVMIRADNVSSLSQLKGLSELILRASPREPLILIERPGASTSDSRPKPGFSPFPSPREIGDRGDALEAFSVYQSMAKELSASGISMNVGPLVDVCRKVKPDRDDLCFGDVAIHAAAFASAFIFAHDEQQVLSAMRFRPAGVSLSSVEMLNLVMNRMEPDALFVDLDAVEDVVTDTIATAQKALRRTGFGGVIIHRRSDVLTSEQTAEALIATLNSGGDMLVFTPSDDWSMAPVLDNLKQALEDGLIKRSRIREAFEFVYRMNWQRRQWRLENSGASVEETSSIYRRPVR